MRDMLAPLVVDPSRTGIFCDFDGSLAQVVSDPSRATAAKGASDALTALASRFKVVAVVSGRPVAFLADQLAAKGVRLVGLYGIEERVGRTLRVLPEAQKARGAILAASNRLQVLLDDQAFVEAKGFAISVHFRRANDPSAAMAASEHIVRGVAEEQGLSVKSGRLVWELAPPTDSDGKGGVVRRLVQQHGLTRAFVAGDDRGDIGAFDAVTDLEACLRVGVESSEMPAELREKSDLIVRGPEDLIQILRELRRLLD